MNLVTLTVSLTLWLTPTSVANWQLDVTPTVVIEANWLPNFGHEMSGLALPHVILLSAPGYYRGWTQARAWTSTADTALAHELQHARQWEHMGPGFALAYVLMPMAFEGYLSAPDPPWAGTELNCPLLRLTANAVSLFPCWHN